MIKVKTKSGIELEVDERIKDDARFLKFATKMQDKDQTKALNAMYSLLDLVFGGDEGTDAFMDAIAQANDGICTQEKLVEEFKEIIEATNLKKS